MVVEGANDDKVLGKEIPVGPHPRGASTDECESVVLGPFSLWCAHRGRERYEAGYYQLERHLETPGEDAEVIGEESSRGPLQPLGRTEVCKVPSEN
jgi:hypothetical protein